MLHRFSRRILLCAVFVTGLGGAAQAAPLSAATPLVRGVVDDAVTVPLARDRPGALATSRDEGALNAAAMLPHIYLALRRPAERQAALDKLTHDQLVRGAADFHHWLVPSQLRGYGPAQADIDKVIAWLRSRGFTVNNVSPSGMSIDFGGSAGNVGVAFHTQLHNVLHRGEANIANVTAPAIPAALAPVVTGVTLSNFFPKPTMRRVTPNLTVSSGKTTYYAVTPSDFATIYNVKALRGTFNFYHRRITGYGQTLAVVEQTQIQSADWVRFRQVFGLTGYVGTLTQSNPGCTSPGTTPDEGEAALDAEWTSAVAPSAHIIEASCAGSAPFGFGVFTALQHLVELGTPATVLSISYGGSEIANGFAFISAWTNVLQEGAAEGKSIFVSTGDSGVSADAPGLIDSNGLDINGLSDSAYNVAVGGTDFYDTALGQNAEYWHQTNGAFLSSAISYVPEIPWDNACTNSIIWKFYKASGPLGFCNSSASANVVQNGVGGGGGQSHFYNKPDWQLTSVLGVPNDGVRDQPDVSLFAANGIWNHLYVFCMSDTAQGGAPCNYGTTNEVFGNAAGGTSFAAPAFAGIQTLVQETFGSTPLGNPAPAYYRIARAQYTTPLGFSRCDATLGNKISSACVFNYVTKGDNSEPCFAGSPDCQSSSAGSIGILAATVAGKNVFAYPAQPGYSLATGLGTVNVPNLLYNYNLNY